ncbi:ParM/StbA family protein [Halotia branconii]|uniref:ParM/StbA family protein n=1 Tax=Halotia branconii CENA392 TaxID=1539056 RepID=A0AAJ6NYR8_9CYAN|nr:ParM/StbA family protein [Halotia branconii]WGV29060.1 ParM/StbA family protein [Halotia branconii CENA392]
MNTPKKEIAPVYTRVAVSVDLGGSQNKIIVQIYPSGVPMVVAMEPEIADVGKNSITQLSENCTWVGIGDEYYVLGALAKNTFAGTPALRDLKSHYALPKVAGLLWLACRQLGLSKGVDASVQLLLPPGEISDGKDLGKKLASALRKGIVTPTGKLKVKLHNFYVAPEGSGIMAYRSRGLGALFGQKNIGMLMLGYRNASFFLSAKGNPTKAESTELGMNWLVQQFVERTAVGLLKDDLRIPLALVSASKGNLNALQSLSRKATSFEVESDLKLFNSVLPDVRDDYCRALIRWIRNIAVLDEVIICGGTAEFVRKELTEHFQKEDVPIVWNGGVQLPKQLDTQGLGDRITDVWTAHITYIKMLDHNFGYERKQNLVPDSYQSQPVRNSTPPKEVWEKNGFLTMHPGV